MVLVDSNVLMRVLQRGHPMYKDASQAVRILHKKKELVLVPQNIVELWVAATRPTEVNGLGMTVTRAAMYLARVRRTFSILPDSPDIHREWQQLVVEHRVSGKKAHDTRLVAAMLVHGVQTIVTFNGADFRRYPGINILHPREIFAGQ